MIIDLLSGPRALNSQCQEIKANRNTGSQDQVWMTGNIGENQSKRMAADLQEELAWTGAPSGFGVVLKSVGRSHRWRED